MSITWTSNQNHVVVVAAAAAIVFHDGDVKTENDDVDPKLVFSSARSFMGLGQ